MGTRAAGPAFARFVREARRRGRETAPLLTQRYEELLPRPLEEVRRELQLPSLREAHPRGVFRASNDLSSLRRVAA